MLLAILSFFAGFLSVLAPCILPLLPIIIGGSFTGVTNKKRPYIIAGSLVFSLILFTLLLKASTSLIGIDPSVWSYISGVIIIILGLVMLFPLVWDRIIGTLGIQAKSQKLLGDAGKQKNGTVSAVLTGLALGPVFSSCSPMYAWVIATVLPESTAKGLFYLGMYCLGLAISLLGVALLGRKLLDKIKWASNPYGWFQKTIAIIFIMVGIAIFTGFDKTVQTYLVDKDFLNIKALEVKLVPEEENSQNNNSESNKEIKNELFNVVPYDAAELTGLQEWINSEPLTLEELKGKVVLIDFWTYSCINCIRTLPYIQGWHENYKDDGLVIIGVHAPEFAFEKVVKNVRNAVEERKLTYPVVLDNNFSTWKAYENRFWPANYLIDKNGQVRRTHFGEGEYDETENAIRQLLEETGSTSLGEAYAVESTKPPIGNDQTPETYIGGSRAKSFTNDELYGGEYNYTLTDSQPLNTWSLGGIWDLTDEYARCIENCALQLHYNSKDVYGVFSESGDVDVNGKSLKITDDDLYTLISNSKITNDILKLNLSTGLQIHAFTFGS